MTLLAAAAALAICTALGGVGIAHAQQLGTGSNALGSGGAALGGGTVPTGDAGLENQRAVAPAALGDCVTNRTAFRTQTNQVTTTSTDFIVMPNTHFPVTTSGGCLIVDFAGLVASGSGGGVYIRAFIAGIGAAEPSVTFLGHPVTANFGETRSMRFVFPNVPAGQHVVRIEFRSFDGGLVGAGNRTMTVQYRP